MQPGGVVEPHDEGPGFLGVPLPVGAPGFGGPQGAEDGGDGEEREADGDRLVHHVAQHLQARQAARQDAAAHQQVGHADHRGQREGAVADEVGRHMDLHPVALQGRDQRLDLVGLAGEAVPQQEGHRRRDHQQHEGAHPPGGVAAFVEQVEQAGDQREQHEHLVEVAHRDVAHVGADQVALVPAHQQPGGAHRDRAPGEGRAGLLGKVGAGQQAQPVGAGGDEDEGAHPHDRRLAGDEVLEEEHLLGPGEVALVERDAAQRQGRRGNEEDPEGLPGPADGRQARHHQQQDGLVVNVHEAAVLAQREHRAAGQREGEQPVADAGGALHAGMGGMGDFHGRAILTSGAGGRPGVRVEQGGEGVTVLAEALVHVQ